MQCRSDLSWVMGVSRCRETPLARNEISRKEAKTISFWHYSTSNLCHKSEKQIQRVEARVDRSRRDSLSVVPNDWLLALGDRHSSSPFAAVL